MGPPRLDGTRLHLRVPVRDGVVLDDRRHPPPPRSRMARAAARRAAAARVVPPRQHPRAVPQRGRERPRGVCGARRGGLSGFRDDRDQRRLPRRDRGYPRRAGRQVRTPPGRAPREQPRQGARPRRGRDCRAPRDSRGDRRRLAPRPRRGHVVRPPLPVRRHARGAYREPAHPQPIVAARPAPGRRVSPPSSD